MNKGNQSILARSNVAQNQSYVAQKFISCNTQNKKKWNKVVYVI